MKKNKTYPPTLFLIAVPLLIFIHFFTPIVDFINYPLNILGLFPIFFGALITIIADRLFKVNETTVKPDEFSKSLVKEWPFSMTRNPMYLGMTLILFGLAFLFGSLATLFIPLIFGIILNMKFIKQEERLLFEEFGDLYTNYKMKVRRWI